LWIDADGYELIFAFILNDDGQRDFEHDWDSEKKCYTWTETR